MIKIKFLLISLGLSLAFISCASNPGTANKAKDLVGTPEDSVIFYGVVDYDYGFSFSQVDRDYAPDYQEMPNSSEYFVSDPVAPGSTYTFLRLAGAVTMGNTTYYWDSYSYLNSTGHIFVIPQTPGLYYVGHYDGYSTCKEGQLVKKTNFFKSEQRVQLECLQEVLNRYKGTVWEQAIRDEMEAVKNEKTSD